MAGPVINDYKATDWWKVHAACRGMDPDIFHPVFDTEAPEAKAVCARCTVRVPCLDFALVTRQEYGVWGGLDEDERRRLRRSRRAG